MKTPCVVLLLIMVCSPATAQEFSSGPSPAERALLATLEPLQTRKTQLEVRLGGLESRQESTRDLAEVITLQKENDQLVLELDDLIRQIEALEPRQGASAQGGGERRGTCVAHVRVAEIQNG